MFYDVGSINLSIVMAKTNCLVFVYYMYKFVSRNYRYVKTHL